MASSFPARWIHGSANCTTNADPTFQVHNFSDNTVILRESKCFNFEGPFLYLLFGSDRTLLLDSGAAPPAGQSLALRALVDGLILQRGLPHDFQLVVGHTHSHGDHHFADSEFASRPHTTIVPPNLAGVKSFWGLPQWPAGEAIFDLGSRVLRIVPAPGHETSHIVIYDETDGLLLTGDTLYPGLLVINDWNAYRQTAERLATFVRGKVINHVLGAHVEMKQTPRELYPIGTTFQPDEHVLQLDSTHLATWIEAVRNMPNPPQETVLNDFILSPQ